MKRGDILHFPTVHAYVMFIEFEAGSSDYIYGFILGYSTNPIASVYFIGDLDKGWPVVGAIVTNLTIELI
jgi:hypothetical protein